ncbi:hypothetical protein F2P81_010321 [Scophthalmus maximus]|uniref:PLAC domain-containing protein n=1 Tax=Scophthalmus maximus TaxID=52904 RepID=A0A6A4SVD3_SCOMX|nr:hypothetical protein F2P81_010321 [Scophthalmus maximus]
MFFYHKFEFPLKTQNGVSIINGNWVIDRPGSYTAVGTQLMYRRPNEIRSRIGESITAPGPLTEDLHVYLIYQQPGPGVYFEYSVPLHNTDPTPEPDAPSGIIPLVDTVDPSHPGDKVHQGDITNNDITKETPYHNQVPPDPSMNANPRPTYTWTKSGHKECSASCGNECGNATQTRSVVCVFNNNGRVEIVDQAKCSSLPQPITAQTCRLKPCGVQWYVTEWSACSRSCNGGYRVREVHCLADNVAPSDRCDPNPTPESREECNKQPCVAEINPSCSDQYHNCMVVVQARLCVYTYYRSVCCASCSRAQNTYPNNSFQKNNIRRSENDEAVNQVKAKLLEIVRSVHSDSKMMLDLTNHRFAL